MPINILKQQAPFRCRSPHVKLRLLKQPNSQLAVFLENAFLQLLAVVRDWRDWPYQWNAQRVLLGCGALLGRERHRWHASKLKFVHIEVESLCECED